MKRIQSACICQTLHFMLKEGTEPNLARRLVQEEAAGYKRKLESSHVKHKILSEETLEDGTILIKLVKQYNQSPVGDYLD